jgi:hypothetical protein
MDDNTLGILGGLVGSLVSLGIGLVVYAYFAYTLMVIANRTGTEGGWMAWVPILNLVLMFNIAQKPLWWIIGMFIPLVNFVVLILVWMAIAERCGKPGWMGLLMLVPGVNFLLPAYFAFF